MRRLYTAENDAMHYVKLSDWNQAKWTPDFDDVSAFFDAEGPEELPHWPSGGPYEYGNLPFRKTVATPDGREVTVTMMFNWKGDKQGFRHEFEFKGPFNSVTIVDDDEYDELVNAPLDEPIDHPAFSNVGEYLDRDLIDNDLPLLEEEIEEEYDLEDVAMEQAFAEKDRWRRFDQKHASHQRVVVANQPLTTQELFGADWKVTHCDYSEEGPLSWSKYGPDINITHYSGLTEVQGTLRGHTIALVVEWITTGMSKEMKKTFDQGVAEKARRLSPAAKKWYREEGEPLVEEPEEYHKGLDFEIEEVRVDGAEAFQGIPVEDYGHDFEDWVSDYTYEILDTIPRIDVLCGLE